MAGGERASGLARRKAIGVLLVAVTAASSCGTEGGRAPRFMSIGTAGTGGIYYPIGGALASKLSLRDSLRQYTAEVTGGSVENINRLRTGEMDLAFALAITMWQAYRGGEDYPQPVTDLRVLAPLYPNMTHVMVAPGSGVRSIADLAGKRVAVGPPGSGTEQISRELLGAYGLTYDDLDPQFLSFAEAASALKDRAIEAATISVGFPASSVLDATTTGGIRLLALDSAVVEAMVSEFPYYVPGEIPAGAYPGVDAPLRTVAVMNWVVGMASLDEDVAVHLLDVLAEERESLVQVHPQAAQIDLAMLGSPPIPLHDAVAGWWAARSGAR